MIKHKQMFKHDPANGVWGDCDRATLACLLNLDVCSVPHFGDEGAAPARHVAARGAWLRRNGWAEMRMAYDGDLPLHGNGGVLHAMGVMNPGIYWMLTGQSGGGPDRNHVVVCCGGDVVHDTHPDEVGVVGPADDGYWHVSWLVPLRFCEPDKLKAQTHD